MEEKGIGSQALTIEQKQAELKKDLGELERRSLFGTLTVLPETVRFETKDSEEQVILVLRKHFATNIAWIFGAIILLLLVWVFWLAGFFPESISGRYQFLIVLLWTLLVFGYSVEQFLIWFFNVYIITNERIVDIDFANLLHREISDADLDKIQDVTVRSSGIAAAIFHYGDIFIQTAAERQVFEFHSVPQPELVSRVMRELIEYNELSFRKEKPG
jgi:uncharacterized membrane protein YdbT with pleckstrin-like domain